MAQARGGPEYPNCNAPKMRKRRRGADEILLDEARSLTVDLKATGRRRGVDHNREPVGLGTITRAMKKRQEQENPSRVVKKKSRGDTDKKI